MQRTRRLARAARPWVRRIRPLVRWAGDLPGSAAAASLVEIAARSAPHRLPVLMYHRIAREADETYFSPDLISATPADFRDQMHALSRRYRFLSLEELLEIRRGQRQPLPRALVLTFDEGYRDFGEHAWPVLRKLGIPATLFVATAFPDSGKAFWWDELHHALTRTSRRESVRTAAGVFRIRSGLDRARTERKMHELTRTVPHGSAMATIQELLQALDVPALEGDVLGWADLRSLMAEGLTVAPHTRTHPRLGRLEPELLEAELVGSREDLVRELGAAPPVMAYPAGDIDAAVAAAAERARYEMAFTTRRGVNDLRAPSWLGLDRINVGRAAAVSLIRTEIATLPPSGPI